MDRRKGDVAGKLSAMAVDGKARSVRLVFEDGSVFLGLPFVFPAAVSGEVVFNAGKVGYPEALPIPRTAARFSYSRIP